MIVLLQIYYWIYQWKNFEHRSTFGEVMANIIVALVFDSQLRIQTKQVLVVKVIWHKTASPPQTDGSLVFSRWHQCALLSGDIGWTCASFDPLESTTQTANRSIGSTVSPQLTAESLCTLQYATLSPNGISIGSAVFAGLTSVTDRQTDHATRSVTLDRIYIRIVRTMRSNNYFF